MYKTEQLLKPLIGTVSQSGSPERGHGLVSETPTFGPLRPRYGSVLRDARFKLDSHGFGLFPYPTPRTRRTARPWQRQADSAHGPQDCLSLAGGSVCPVIEPQPKSWRSSHGLG